MKLFKRKKKTFEERLADLSHDALEIHFRYMKMQCSEKYPLVLTEPQLLADKLRRLMYSAKECDRIAGIYNLS